jgi:integrase
MILDTSNIIQQYRQSHGDGGNGSHLDIVAAYFEGKPADDTLSGEVDLYRACQSTVSPATLNRRLACLRAALNWAVKRRLLKYNPVGVWELSEEKPRTRILTTEEELNLLVALAGTWLYLPVKFALRNPVRAGDLWALNTDMVDLDHGWVSFDAGKTGNRTYLVVWDEELRAYFQEARKRLGPLFLNTTGERVCTYRRDFESACVGAGIDGFRFHDLRRCAASWMLEKGGFKPSDLTKLGLWKSWATVEKFYHAVEVHEIQQRVVVNG